MHMALVDGDDQSKLTPRSTLTLLLEDITLFITPICTQLNTRSTLNHTFLRKAQRLRNGQENTHIYLSTNL